MRRCIIHIFKSFLTGGMRGSFLLLFGILTLYGSFLIYDEVRKTGCDPTGQVPGNKVCKSTGAAVFGAMLGISFAGQGLSQVADFIEAFTAARTACFPALLAIKRSIGSLQGQERDIVPETGTESGDETGNRKDETGQSSRQQSVDEEQGKNRVEARLPKYEIDSFSDRGLKPDKIVGSVAFESVYFTHP